MVAILHEFKVRLQVPPKTFDIHPVFRPTLENRLFVLGQPDSSNGAYQGSDLGGFVNPSV